MFEMLYETSILAEFTFFHNSPIHQVTIATCHVVAGENGFDVTADNGERSGWNIGHRKCLVFSPIICGSIANIETEIVILSQVNHYWCEFNRVSGIVNIDHRFAKRIYRIYRGKKWRFDHTMC